MGRKKGKTKNQGDGAGPRRGKRRSIRYEAEEHLPEDRPPVKDDAPPAVHLRKLTLEEAFTRLDFQLRAFAGQGRREVLVIHGKGQGSVGGISVLGPKVRKWCDEHPALVSSWREAPVRWGGSGAIVVVLNT